MVGQIGQIGQLVGAIGGPLTPITGGGEYVGLDVDFVKGRYALNGPYSAAFPTGWTFSRSSQKLAASAAGVLMLFAAGLPAITDKGLLVEEQRTNKVTVNNANPVDTTGLTKAGDAASVLSVVDDVAALAAAGLSGICTSGKVFMLDNSLGVATASVANNGGASGNVNVHAWSAYVRGSGVASFRTATGGTVIGSTFAVGASYARFDRSSAPNALSVGWNISAAAGAVVYFILPQYEEGAFVTSPIVTTGAAATRANDSAILVSLGAMLAGVFTVAVELSMDAIDGTERRFWVLSDGTSSNRVIHGKTIANNMSAFSVSGGATGSPAAISGYAGALVGVKTAVRQLLTGDLRLAVNNVLSSSVATPPPISVDRLLLGTSASSSQAVFIKRLRIIPGDMTDAQLQALTT